MIETLKMSASYLRKLADFPLSIVVDSGGESWTWCEARSYAIALRGVVEGLDGAPMWGEPGDWRVGMRLVFGPSRRRYSRMYQHADLIEWAGTPWQPPHDSCPSCAGTGKRGGRPADMARGGSLTAGIRLDLNLLATVLPLLDPGPIVVDARLGVAEDPIRLRSVTGDTRAVIARLQGPTRACSDTFESWLELRAPSHGLGGGPVSPSSLSSSSERAEIGAPMEGPGDRRCPCGGAMRSGQCLRCGAIVRGAID